MLPTRIGLLHLAHVLESKPARLETASFADYSFSLGVFVVRGFSTFTTKGQPLTRRSRSVLSNLQQHLTWGQRSSINCGTASPGAVRFLIGTRGLVEPDKLAPPAEVQLTRECEQDKISIGGEPAGRVAAPLRRLHLQEEGGWTSQDSWRPRSRDTGLASKERGERCED